MKPSSHTDPLSTELSPEFNRQRSDEKNGSGKHKQNGNSSKTKENGLNRSARGIVQSELRELLHVVKAMRKGEFNVRFGPKDGLVGEIGEVLNDILDLNESMSNEFARVANVVGEEGKITERASIGPVKGAWATSMESVNSLIINLAQPIREFARVITSVAHRSMNLK